ncbi:MAG TPA: hypothetical protein VFO16_02900 [Pseudonocardiaceae bacterium]|nr:hypothetical protein [Pseudonocardiaceae bacterium]
MGAASDNDSLSPVYLILILLARGLVLSPFMVPTAMKGKWGFFAIGWIFPIFWIVGAIRLAMPDSYWARRFYSPAKMNEARYRFRRRVFDSKQRTGEDGEARGPDCRVS